MSLLLRRIFGMPKGGPVDDLLLQLEHVIDRQTPVNTIASLLAATQVGAQGKTLPGAAVCLDTNIFFKLAGDGDSSQVVDYLASKHEEPVIVSAQALQEVWNNYLNGIATVATDLKVKFDALSAAVSELDSGFLEYRGRFDALLAEFKQDFGHLHRAARKENIRVILEMLDKKAEFSEVPRSRFSRYYEQRKITKTPPGFKDDGAGDYYVWLDFLFGLKRARDDGRRFERAVLVSEDRKADWVRGGVPHPTLSAECSHYVGVPLEIWTLNQLTQATRGQA